MVLVERKQQKPQSCYFFAPFFLRSSYRIISSWESLSHQREYPHHDAGRDDPGAHVGPVEEEGEEAEGGDGAGAADLAYEGEATRLEGKEAEGEGGEEADEED